MAIQFLVRLSNGYKMAAKNGSVLVSPVPAETNYSKT
jgi:hypothetical protein